MARRNASTSKSGDCDARNPNRWIRVKPRYRLTTVSTSIVSEPESKPQLTNMRQRIASILQVTAVTYHFTRRRFPLIAAQLE
mmetsp:Transcript_3736/g.7134  ORF Transcript_3736/g.7134 Transcript_3736/m.7134 type:complete len:82 (+) Transcript_3736:925-1170(+)